MEPDHLEGKGLCPIIGQILEGDIQINLPKWHGLLSRHDAVERRPGWPNARSVDTHGIEHFSVHDVEAVPPSISTLVSHFVSMIGSTTSGYLPGCGMLSKWSDWSKVMADSDHQRKVGVAGSAV